jgi:hypothetical protein
MTLAVIRELGLPPDIVNVEVAPSLMVIRSVRQALC